MNSSWGSTGVRNEAIPVQRLHSMRATVLSNLACRWLRVDDSQMCTDFEEGTPCYGDEGSALFTTEFDSIRTQIGIYSHHFSLGCERSWPPMYTRTTHYLDWIQNNSDVVIRQGFD
jgi:chymotrypsin-like protease